MAIRQPVTPRQRATAGRVPAVEQEQIAINKMLTDLYGSGARQLHVDGRAGVATRAMREALKAQMKALGINPGRTPAERLKALADLGAKLKANAEAQQALQNQIEKFPNTADGFNRPGPGQTKLPHQELDAPAVGSPAAPRTESPAAAPRTESPAAAPATESPAAAPRTESPAAAPATESPAAAPRTESPAAAPATESPAAAPRTESPAAAPATESPAAAPRTESPAGAPRTESPAAAPRTESPAAAPATESPAAAPRTESPAGAPRTESPAAAPATESPAAAPRTESPAGAPRTESPAAAPATESPAAAPRTESPAAAPRTESPAGEVRLSGYQGYSNQSYVLTSLEGTADVPTPTPSGSPRINNGIAPGSGPKPSMDA